MGCASSKSSSVDERSRKTEEFQSAFSFADLQSIQRQMLRDNPVLMERLKDLQQKLVESANNGEDTRNTTNMGYLAEMMAGMGDMNLRRGDMGMSGANIEQAFQMLNNPALLQMMNQMMSNPATMQVMIDSNPMVQQLREQNPQVPLMMPNLDMIHSTTKQSTMQSSTGMNILGDSNVGGSNSGDNKNGAAAFSHTPMMDQLFGGSVDNNFDNS